MPRLDKNVVFQDRYVLVRKLGTGGFSEVWLAHDNKADIDVALKVFAPEKGMDDKGIEVFSKEYSLVFNLNHSNLLKPSYFDDYDGSPYLVLPFCKNGSALDMMGEMTEAQLAKFIFQSASAIDYLHDQDPPIIHQDIKPDNFLIDDKGNFLLSDFGISSRIKRVLTRSVGRQNSSGTLPYMPPEKFVKERQTIKASDIFSLGVTYYELLTGELPFGEHGGLLLNTGAEIPDLPPKFSREVNSLINACLSKEPWNRPIAEQLKDIAQEFMKTGIWNLTSLRREEKQESAIETAVKEDSPIQPRKEGRKTEQMVFTDSIDSPEKEAETYTPPKKQPEKKNKNTLPLILIIAAVIVIGGVITFFVLNKSGKKEKTITTTQDTIKNKEIIKAKADSAQKALLAKRKQDSLKSSGDKKKTDEKTVVEQKPVIEEKKVTLTSIYCNGRTIYIHPGNNSSKASWSGAWSICSNLTAYGYSDWYLPSKEELNCLFDQQAKIGGFGNHDFWSSSGSGEYGWSQNFYDGHQYNTDKTDDAYVRCIRK